jgi:hypothetical protein
VATVKAIEEIRRYLATHADTPSAELLARLPATLFREGNLELRDLYTLDWESFQLAIELLRDWRIDRYYADSANLLAGMLHPVGPQVPEAVATR